MALLEATSISGVAKAVLQFAEQAAHSTHANPQVIVSIANFVRGDTPANKNLSDAATSAGCSLETIHEKRALDFSVIHALRFRVNKENPDVIWSNSVKSHFLVRAAGIQNHRAWVAFHHGYTFTDLKMKCYNQLDRWSLRAPDRVLTVCRPFAAELTKRGVPRDRVRVQHMSIRGFQIAPAQTDRLRKEMRLEAGETVLLTVGRLSKEKAHSDLLKAFAIYQNRWDGGKCRLIIVGGGPEQTRLQQLCNELGIQETVSLTGHRDDARLFYGIADMFVLPSLTEGSPNVLLEALASRVPVVATIAGGVPEIVEDGISALLVNPGEPEALAGAIKRLMNSQDLRERVVANGEAVTAEHSPEKFYESLVSVFQEALLRKRGLEHPSLQKGL